MIFKTRAQATVWLLFLQSPVNSFSRITKEMYTAWIMCWSGRFSALNSLSVMNQEPPQVTACTHTRTLAFNKSSRLLWQLFIAAMNSISIFVIMKHDMIFISFGCLQNIPSITKCSWSVSRVSFSALSSRFLARKVFFSSLTFIFSS